MSLESAVPEIQIVYRFRFEDREEWSYPVELDPHTYESRTLTAAALPEWTKLEFQQCKNCPLSSSASPRCPAAVSLVELVDRIDSLPSYSEADVEVHTPERVVSCTTTVQRGVGSLLGLLLAASGCPHTAYFRPMARFHLPMASESETVYRAASMYMMAQYFRNRAGRAPDLDMQGLTEIYTTVQQVNRGLAGRLKSACQGDGAVNALVLLDLLAKALPVMIDEELEDMRGLFACYHSE